MRSDGFVVLQVGHKDLAQVLLTYHNNMVEAFPPDRTDQLCGIKKRIATHTNLRSSSATAGPSTR
jgi:hypothetical protein